MEEIFVFEFGRFVGERKPGMPRDFIPVFSQELPKSKMEAALKEFVVGWRPKLFDAWLNRSDRPRTFMLGESNGYRVTQLNDYTPSPIEEYESGEHA
jgi:hypothetical protein